MKRQDNTIHSKNPEGVRDLLTETIREGAKQLLIAAVEAELEEFLSVYQEHRTPEGKTRFVRNGHLPEGTFIFGQMEFIYRPVWRTLKNVF